MTMRAFIQCDSTGLPCNPNAFTAFAGLLAMGYECVFFQKYNKLFSTPLCQLAYHPMG